ncbi:MAG: hypothetical protein D6706_09895 [Chloroflexi bacterium]|nr:MAG: hypothetical protein D6706_09895 [Chloroflexota bacterium]
MHITIIKIDRKIKKKPEMIKRQYIVILLLLTGLLTVHQSKAQTTAPPPPSSTTTTTTTGSSVPVEGGFGVIFLLAAAYALRVQSRLESGDDHQTPLS